MPKAIWKRPVKKTTLITAFMLPAKSAIALAKTTVIGPVGPEI